MEADAKKALFGQVDQLFDDHLGGTSGFDTSGIGPAPAPLYSS
jgi:hypothetical protein